MYGYMASTHSLQIYHYELLHKLFQLIGIVFELVAKVSFKSGLKEGLSLLKATAKYLIKTCFFTCGNIAPKHRIVISLGIAPAPFWVILVLYLMKINSWQNVLFWQKVLFMTERFIHDKTFYSWQNVLFMTERFIHDRTFYLIFDMSFLLDSWFCKNILFLIWNIKI